jgi:hypothetical protein
VAHQAAVILHFLLLTNCRKQFPELLRQKSVSEIGGFVTVDEGLLRATRFRSAVDCATALPIALTLATAIPLFNRVMLPGSRPESPNR